MKKISAIFTIFVFVFVATNAFAFSKAIDVQCIEGKEQIRDQNLISKIHSDQICVQEDKICIDLQGVMYPIAKFYIESRQILEEGLLDLFSQEPGFIIFVTCPKCGQEFLIGQGHQCNK